MVTGWDSNPEPTDPYEVWYYHASETRTHNRERPYYELLVRKLLVFF